MYSTITKKTCKWFDCPKSPVVGLKGFCYDHADEELIEKKNNARKESKKKSQRNQRERLKVAKHAVKILWKPRQKTPIPKASKKRLAELKIYSVLRKDFLKDHPTCEVKLEGCKKKAVDVHHVVGRSNGNLNNVDTWLAACRHCHNTLHINSKMAREKGLLK